MRSNLEGALLWQPDAERAARANLTHYIGWLAQRGRRFHSYEQLLKWSLDDLDGFWRSVWEYFDIRSSQDRKSVV